MSVYLASPRSFPLFLAFLFSFLIMQPSFLPHYLNITPLIILSIRLFHSSPDSYSAV